MSEEEIHNCLDPTIKIILFYDSFFSFFVLHLVLFFFLFLVVKIKFNRCTTVLLVITIFTFNIALQNLPGRGCSNTTCTIYIKHVFVIFNSHHPHFTNLQIIKIPARQYISFHNFACTFFSQGNR